MIKARIKIGYGRIAYLGHLLHVCNHFIVTFRLLAEPREEGLAVEELASRSNRCLEHKGWFDCTFHAIGR